MIQFYVNGGDTARGEANIGTSNVFHNLGVNTHVESIAHILTLHYDKSVSWIENFICNPEPSSWTRSSVQVNGEIFELQNLYDC